MNGLRCIDYLINRLTSNGVAVLNGGGKRRKVVFGIDVLSEHPTQAICGEQQLIELEGSKMTWIHLD